MYEKCYECDSNISNKKKTVGCRHYLMNSEKQSVNMCIFGQI